MYELQIRPKAERFLKKQIQRDFNQINKTILSLKNTPRPAGVEKLIDEIYRIRIGDFRIIYMINDKEKVVDIGKVDRRRERTYKELKSLF